MTLILVSLEMWTNTAGLSNIYSSEASVLTQLDFWTQHVGNIWLYC